MLGYCQMVVAIGCTMLGNLRTCTEVDDIEWDCDANFLEPRGWNTPSANAFAAKAFSVLFSIVPRDL